MDFLKSLNFIETLKNSLSKFTSLNLLMCATTSKYFDSPDRLRKIEKSKVGNKEKKCRIIKTRRKGEMKKKVKKNSIRNKKKKTKRKKRKKGKKCNHTAAGNNESKIQIYKKFKICN